MQTKSYADADADDADADGIHTKNNMSPTPSEGGHNFKLLARFCACTGRFVSDLCGNHIVGFPTRWLKSNSLLYFVCLNRNFGHNLNEEGLLNIKMMNFVISMTCIDRIKAKRLTIPLQK